MQGFERPREDLDQAVEKWRGQSRKGFLELCTLGCVKAAGRIYGFAMMERLVAAGLDVGEGSLYPLLARLVREGMLEAAWETPEEGHPRKYYRLTGFGTEFLARIREATVLDRRAYDAIVKEEGPREED